LKVKPREGESTTLTLDINPKDLWASQGIFSFVGEFGDESGEKRTQGERVLELLSKFSPSGLEYQEIDRYLNVGKSLYTVLDRLEDRQLITKRRSHTDARRWVYCLPCHTTDEDNATNEDGLTTKDTPPPSSFSSGVELMSETTTGKEDEVSQQLFNINSTVSQQPEWVDWAENAQTVDEARNTEAKEISQHIPKDEGERGVVEQVKIDNVLQTEPARNSSTTGSTHLKTFSPTNPFNQSLTSQQKAFTKKYQPVEVLNSEGEWVRGYFVHKCLVVANLAGRERKYALYDESGAKYVFWGEIRLPRVEF
jgi:hypothetical protein